jgi:nucleoside-diphosphate-sugar epimerase
MLDAPGSQAQADGGRHGGRSSQRPLILITGSSGVIGTRLAAALAPHCDVVGLDLDCDGAEHRCIETDLTDDASLAAALAGLAREHGRSIAVVFHLAAYYDLSGADHPLYQQLNVDGTRRLLQALREDFDVGLFVYAGTMLVHAPTLPGLPITEDAPLAPKWAYPASKLAAEQVIGEARGALPTVLLRVAGVYTDDCGSPFIAHQIQRLYERRITASLYAGNTRRGQAFIHVDDLIALCVRLVERRERFHGLTPMLAGEPEAMSYQALQNRLAELLHGAEGWRTHSLPPPIAAAGAWLQQQAQPLVPDGVHRGEEPFIRPYMTTLAEDHYELDIGRARGLLDWSPKHRLRDVLATMVEHLQADAAGWYRRNKLTPPPWLTTAEEQDEDPAEIHAAFERVQRDEHDATRWAPLLNIALGAWLLASPATLGYAQRAMAWSDLAAGALVLLFAALSLSWRHGWARLPTAGVGLWLMAAPVVFSTPDAAAYLNATLVGALVFCCAVVIAPMPGVAPMAKLTGPDIPAGWAYSPSAWTQRLPISALAFLGLLVTRWLAAQQLGHSDATWDPFFGADSAGAWPAPGAGLAALLFLLVLLTGLIGGRNRWRTLPWVVVLSSALILLLGPIGIALSIAQPVLTGAWCTPCLAAALVMLLQIPYACDELAATLQFLGARRRKGKPVLRVLLFGDTADGRGMAPAGALARAAGAVLRDMLGGGVTLPWSLALSALIGVGLMTTRRLLDTTGTRADSDWLLGALALCVSVVALAEVVRGLRFANLLVGAALIGAPFLLSGGSMLANGVGIGAGVLLILLAIPRGKVLGRSGGSTLH